MGRGTIRGAIGALAVASLVLAVGWVTPWPEPELQPYAARSDTIIWLMVFL